MQYSLSRPPPLWIWVWIYLLLKSVLLRLLPGESKAPGAIGSSTAAADAATRVTPCSSQMQEGNAENNRYACVCCLLCVMRHQGRPVAAPARGNKRPILHKRRSKGRSASAGARRACLGERQRGSADSLLGAELSEDAVLRTSEWEDVVQLYIRLPTVQLYASGLSCTPGRVCPLRGGG